MSADLKVCFVCAKSHLSFWIVSLYEVGCHFEWYLYYYSTMYVQCYVRNFVNMNSANCMLKITVLKACIVMLCHTIFVVHAVIYAVVTTCMQTVSSKYVI